MRSFRQLLLCLIRLHGEKSEILGHDADHQTAGDDAGDLSGDVGAGGLHKDNVSLFCFRCELLHDAGGHREGGDPAAAEDFYYKGKKPSTKEQLILMVCDSVEAASRTLKDNSPETFSAFVESIVAGKMKAGQFDEADISIKQLNTVKQVLKNYLGQIYHERIVYPGERNGETEKTKQ